MVFLSNYLVFKIVLAALGRTDYPVAGDLELKYDTANKIYLSGGSLDYVDDVTPVSYTHLTLPTILRV